MSGSCCKMFKYVNVIDSNTCVCMGIKNICVDVCMYSPEFDTECLLDLINLARLAGKQD